MTMNEKILLLCAVLFGLFPYVGAANPGLQVTVDPDYIETTSDSTVMYDITVANMDACDPDTGWCYKHIIKYINLNDYVKCSDCTYSFSPDLIDTTVLNGHPVTTQLSVYIPPGKSVGTLLEHQVDVKTQVDVYDSYGHPEDPGYWNYSFTLSPYPDFPDTGQAAFNTKIIAGPAIPEFPTIAIPIISVLGLVFMLHRKK